MVGKFMGDNLSLRGGGGGVLPQENLEIWSTLGAILSLLDPYFQTIAWVKFGTIFCWSTFEKQQFAINIF